MARGTENLAQPYGDRHYLREESDVEASITTPVISIRNPRSGHIQMPAVLNDKEAARSLLSRLPCTVAVCRGSVDFCGDMGEPLD